MAGLAVWIAVALVSSAGSDACVGRTACSTPPAPDAGKKTVLQGHGKPSSYAPQPRSPNHAYGAPIQKPILSRHKRAKHRTGHSPPAKKIGPRRGRLTA
jgi:hypothetical protein